jgi:DNA mismatch endonuclease (patch repair protein)
MRKVRSSGTGLERRMEDMLKANGMRYERQPALFGRPDFRIIGTIVLIFCDSSFWHGKRKREASGEAFKSNRALWTEKLARNRRRDVQVTRRLRAEGWSVLRFSDVDIIRRPRLVMSKLGRAIDEER